MKKIAILLIMCAITLTASAQMGWLYQDNIAVLSSTEEYLGDDFNKPTTLTIMLDGSEEGEIAVLGLQGDFALFKFRDNQQYILADFNGVRTKWEIKTVEVDGKFLKYINVVDASKFIDKLCECDFFSITLPLAVYGTITFYFDANGYPLDW